mgnify:CR=1 FL=1
MHVVRHGGQDHGLAGVRVAAAIDARMDEVYFGAFEVGWRGYASVVLIGAIAFGLGALIVLLFIWNALKFLVNGPITLVLLILIALVTVLVDVLAVGTAAEVAAVVRNFLKAPGTEKLMPSRVAGEVA